MNNVDLYVFPSIVHRQFKGGGGSMAVSGKNPGVFRNVSQCSGSDCVAVLAALGLY